jgi:hypothetical protein
VGCGNRTGEEGFAFAGERVELFFRCITMWV